MADSGLHQRLHLVNGEWLTTRQAAEAMGIKVKRLYNWRSRRRRDGKPATMQDAWDYYDAINSGQRRRHPGQTSRLYDYHGRPMTIAEIHAYTDLNKDTIYTYRLRHGCTTQQAIDACSANSTKRAVNRIMRIMGFRR